MSLMVVLTEFVIEHFNITQRVLVKMLDLLQLIYTNIPAFGREEPEFSLENIDKAALEAFI